MRCINIICSHVLYVISAKKLRSYNIVPPDYADHALFGPEGNLTGIYKSTREGYTLLVHPSRESTQKLVQMKMRSRIECQTYCLTWLKKTVFVTCNVYIYDLTTSMCTLYIDY